VTYFWLTAITASRLLCGPLWAVLWWKPRRLRALWMVLIAAWFLLTDHFDGHWARDGGLESTLGKWLDHGSDVVFYSCVVFSLVFGSGDAPPLVRRGRATAAHKGETITPPPGPSPPAA
jgi:phosphatidylglycerophosphate synthase